jgi:hypothetical protein
MSISTCRAPVTHFALRSGLNLPFRVEGQIQRRPNRRGVVDQRMWVWRPPDAEKPTGVGFSVGADLTKVPLLEALDSAYHRYRCFWHHGRFSQHGQQNDGD